MKYFAVVVIYNKNIDDSETCQLLKKIAKYEINIIIVDNSTLENNNNIICQRNGWVYLSQGKNLGLSKGYNMALDYLKEEKDGCVIWFDDDSKVTQEYFDELDLILSETNAEIIAPVICGQNGKFYSPNEARFFKNKQLKKSTDKIKMNKFNAINSCTAVRINIYKDYRYDERLFLDQVDHSFFRDQRKAGRRFYKMKTVIEHNFSLKSKMATIDDLKKRYKIMIPDFLTYCSDDKWLLFLGKIKVFGWGIRESIRYKEYRFLPWCLGEANKIIIELKI